MNTRQLVFPNPSMSQDSFNDLLDSLNTDDGIWNQYPNLPNVPLHAHPYPPNNVLVLPLYGMGTKVERGSQFRLPFNTSLSVDIDLGSLVADLVLHLNRGRLNDWDERAQSGRLSGWLNE